MSSDNLCQLAHDLKVKIVSYLPTKEAVTTCGIFTLWKNVYKDLQSFCFDQDVLSANYKSKLMEIAKEVIGNCMSDIIEEVIFNVADNDNNSVSLGLKP